MSEYNIPLSEDPAFTGSRPSPTLPNGGTFSCFNKVRIDAPAEAVYNALVDVSTWKEWNNFVPEVTCDEPGSAAQKDGRPPLLLTEGMDIMLHCRMGGDGKTTKSGEVVVQVGPLKTRGREDTEEAGLETARSTIRWVAKGYPSFLLKAEHVNWIDDNGDGTTTYTHWETFGGAFAIAIRTMFGASLHGHFIAWAENLKAYVEKQPHGAGK